MNQIRKSLLWAAAILAAAWISSANGLSDGAAFGVVAGLSAAALGSILGGTRCRAGCRA